MDGEKGSFLIVEDDEMVARNLKALLLLRWEVRAVIARSVSAARAFLDGGARPRGFLVDVRLPDGDGMELAKEIRSRLPLAAIAIFTGLEPAALLDATNEIDALFIRKPSGERQIGLFVARARAPRLLGDSLRRGIEALTLHRPLSPRERQYVEAKLAHRKDRDLGSDWGVTAKTIASTRRSVIAKAGDDDLDAFLQRVWRHATDDAETRRDETRRDETRRARTGPVVSDTPPTIEEAVPPWRAYRRGHGAGVGDHTDRDSGALWVRLIALLKSVCADWTDFDLAGLDAALVGVGRTRTGR